MQINILYFDKYHKKIMKYINILNTTITTTTTTTNNSTNKLDFILGKTFIKHRDRWIKKSD